jgi:hypothetical protein
VLFAEHQSRYRSPWPQYWMLGQLSGELNPQLISEDPVWAILNWGDAQLIEGSKVNAHTAVDDSCPFETRRPRKFKLGSRVVSY